MISAGLFDFCKQGSSAFCVLEESPHQLLHLLTGNLLGQRTLSDQNVICDVIKNIENIMLVPDPPPNGLQFL